MNVCDECLTAAYDEFPEATGFDDYVEEGECPCAGKCDADNCECWESCWVHA